MSHLSLVIVTFLLLSKIQISDGTWRYKNILEDERLFTLNNAIFLEYEGSSFTEWQYPKTCEVKNKSSPHAIMKCKSSGFQAVRPLISDTSIQEEERYLYVRDSLFSFAWYTVTSLERNANETDSQVVRIWIIDPDQAEQAEINNTALVPSRQSLLVSKQFFNMGQSPMIKLLSSTQSLQGVFTTEGYWEAVLPGNQMCQNFYIDGQPVSFQNRFVMPNQFTFFDVAQEDPYTGTEISLHLSAGSQVSVVQTTCASYQSLLLSDKGSFMTKNDFHTYEEIKVKPGNIPVPPEGYFTVSGAAMLEDGIIFHIGDTLLWRGKDKRLQEVQEKGQLVQGVRGLTQRVSCVDYYPVQNVELATVIVWRDHDLFVGGRCFNKADNSSYLHPVVSLPSDMTFLTASFSSHPACLTALVMQTHTGVHARPLLLTLNELEGVWWTNTSLTKFNEEDFPQGPFKIHSVMSAVETLMIWNREIILYNFHGDSGWDYLQALETSNLSLAANGSHVHQVAIDHRWNMLVKMENNVLLYCKAGMHSLVRLHKWMEPGNLVALYLDQKDQISMLTLTEQGLSVLKYPMFMEAMSAMHGGSHQCPFRAFSHSMNTLVYYLDKSDHLEFWAQVVYPEGRVVQVQLHSNQMNLVHIMERNHFETVEGVVRMNKSFTVIHQLDYRENMSYSDMHLKSSGTVTLELMPDQIGNTCNLPQNRISYFHAGCPPNRHIRVARPWGVPCKMHTLENYKIPGFVLRNPQKEDLHVDYDWEKFGCVLKIHYKAAFRPDLDLYDGDTFVQSVDANFIVWERFGRSDYSFNATMHQVGCLHEAQSWTSMLTGDKPLEEAWGPENYRSCFDIIPGESGNLNQPYEILNRSSSNHLTFSQEDSAIYIFNVKIVEPVYSFCDLHTVFAVQTFGIKKESSYQDLYTYLVLCFIFIVQCILSYKYWSFVIIFRKVLAYRQQT